MKKVVLSIISFLIFLHIVISVSIVKAQWSAINSGYAVTTNWHGKEVPIGESVTAWAGTTNQNVYQVEFLWKNPANQTVFAVNVTNLVAYTTPEYPPGAPQEIINWAANNTGITIYYANNTQIPNSLGDWGVQVRFYAPGGHICGQGSDIIKIKSTSFNVIPDAPIVGTAGLVAAMFLGFYFFKHKPSLKS